MDAPNPERERVFDLFRHWGYLEADLDPLGMLRPQTQADLQMEGDYAREARRFYCGTIGTEFMHITEPDRRRWIQERMEAESGAVDQPRVLDLLVRADVFEQVLQQRYLGTKRFSLEGNTALLPLVDEILEGAAQRGAINLVMGMSHRGRLNVILHVTRRTPEEIFAAFRRRRSAQRPGLRRCEVPSGGDRRVHHAQWRQGQYPPGFESQPSRSC